MYIWLQADWSKGGVSFTFLLDPSSMPIIYASCEQDIGDSKSDYLYTDITV